MHSTGDESDASSVASEAARRKKNRDIQAGMTPFERQVKAELDKRMMELYPFPARGTDGYDKKYNRVCKVRNKERPAIEKQIRAQVEQQRQQVAGAGKKAPPAESPAQGLTHAGSAPQGLNHTRSPPNTPRHSAQGSIHIGSARSGDSAPSTPRSTRHSAQGSFGSAASTPSSAARAITPMSLQGTPMPARMVDMNAYGEMPQRDQSNVFWSQLVHQLDQSNKEHSSMLADKLLAANLQSQSNAQDKNNQAAEKAQDKNNQAAQQAQDKNNQAAQQAQQSNTEAITMLDSSHQQHTRDLFAQAFAAATPTRSQGIASKPMRMQAIVPMQALPEEAEEDEDEANTPHEGFETPSQQVFETPFQQVVQSTTKKRRREADSASASTTSSARGLSGRPPRPPEHVPMTSVTVRAPAHALAPAAASNEALDISYLVVPPEGTPYFLDQLQADQVVQWTMSQHRITFLMNDGSVGAYPFLQREQLASLNKSLIYSQEHHLPVSGIAARGSSTYTLGTDKRTIFFHRGGVAGIDNVKTRHLSIQGLRHEDIQALYAGDGYLVIVYEDYAVVDLVGGNKVKKRLELGALAGNPIKHVHTGATFVIVEFDDPNGAIETGALHCFRVGDKSCTMPNGPLKLPRGWQGLRVAVGFDHCLVQAGPDGSSKKQMQDADRKLRVYAVGRNSHGQLGKGGNPTTTLKLVTALKEDHVDAVFAVSNKNQSYTLNSNGQLKCFGDIAWTANNSKPQVVTDGDMDCQDIGIADNFVFVAYKAYGQDDFAFCKVDNATGLCTRIALNRSIAKVYGIQTGGDHVCVKVGIKKMIP